MPSYFIYVYSPSDFIGGLPDEFNAAAAGTPTFTLQLAPGATGTQIEVTDADFNFDEVSSSQELTNTSNIDGTTYAAGTTIISAYDLINTGSGHKVTSFHLGGTGYQQGAVDGLISTVPLVEGTTYTFNQERSSYLQNNPYDEYVSCFAKGTKIQTTDGLVEVSKIKAGNKVVTLENGIQEVLWAGKSDVAGVGDLAPICFAPGTIGNSETLRLSPNHRVFVSNPTVQLYFGSPAALVAAKFMVNDTTIVREEVEQISYFHILTAQHDIVFANGAPTETLFLGNSKESGLCEQANEEIRGLFPDLMAHVSELEGAYPFLRAHEAALLGDQI